jgi:hypothetical protein
MCDSAHFSAGKETADFDLTFSLAWNSGVWHDGIFDSFAVGVGTLRALNSAAGS